MLILKRLKLEENNAEELDNKIVEEVDHISSVGDALLCHILSFLSTKQAVRTSALSKRWKNVWTKTPVLDFSECPEAGDKDSNFPCFASRVLFLNNTSHLKKLCFDDLLEFDLVHVNAWFSNLILRDIEEICLYNRINNQPFDMCVMFLTRLHLVILKLCGGAISQLPILVKFSNLKVVHLTDVQSPNNNLNRLVAGCPVLEELSIHNCRWPCVDIKSSTLKRLTVYYLVDSINQLLVRAPNLEQLSLSCLQLCSSYFSPMKCLINGRISHCTVPLPLLRIFSRVKSFCLNSPWIEDSVMNAIAGHRLMFSNLTNLKLEVTQDALLVMPEILKCSPSLVYFFFIKGNIVEPTCGQPNQGKWITPSTMLECLSSLNSIEISYCEDSENYLDMIQYFLKNAKVLKKMKLIIKEMASGEEIRLLRKLLLVPRASVTCQVRICHPTED